MICINDDGVYLTSGRRYEVQYCNGDYVAVVNDIGKVSEYHISHFN